MVIDTSAVLAILMGEVEAEQYALAISHDSRRLMCAFSLFETSVVVEARKGEDGSREWDLLRMHINLEVVPFTDIQQTLALDAWRKFGKGRHPAALNIGDCCSYSLAKLTGKPLLYKGGDFAQTDVQPAFATKQEN